MPSKSAKQAKFMRAVAHSPEFAKKVGVSQSVGKDFSMADKKMKKFGSGGWSGRGSVTVPLDEPEMTMKAPAKKLPKKIPPSGPTAADRAESDKYREGLKKVKVTPKEGEVINSANRSEGGGHKKGGKIMKKSDKAGRAMVKKSADTMGRAMMAKGGKCYAKGGSIDGIAKKGKTRGKMC